MPTTHPHSGTHTTPEGVWCGRGVQPPFLRDAAKAGVPAALLGLGARTHVLDDAAAAARVFALLVAAVAPVSCYDMHDVYVLVVLVCPA